MTNPPEEANERLPTVLQFGEELTDMKVEQVDREAVVDMIDTYWQGRDENMNKLSEAFKNGHSQGTFVRAFAAHRHTERARLIVTAVNAYEPMLAALEKARKMCISAIETNITGIDFDPASHPVIQEIDAAISQAKEQQS